MQELEPNNPWAVAAELGQYSFKFFALWGARPDRRGGAGYECECGRVGCGQPGKHPRRAGWQEAATSHPTTLAMFARMYPRANVGCRTGHVSGLVLIDVDGEQGVESLERLEKELGALPPTVRSRSGREGVGFHLWFRLDPDGPEPRNSAGTLGAGVDVRAGGGYFVIPGSRHKSGRRYAWEAPPSTVDFAPLPPAWLAAMLATRGAAPEPAKGQRATMEAKIAREPTRARDLGSLIIGDGPDGGGFDSPIFRRLCRYFARQPNAPAEPMIAALKVAVAGAVKGPGRDVRRYLSDYYLDQQAEKARAFAISRRDERK
jgi:hypothetical protein